MFEELTDSVKSLGGKVVSLFETKEKTVEEIALEKAIEEIAHEKAEHDKKVAEDFVKEASDAITKASSDATKKIGETVTDMRSGVKKLTADCKDKIVHGSQAAADAVKHAVE